jgi:hypothetical protein
VPRTYDRDSAEFNRILAFTDGLFAIAMEKKLPREVYRYGAAMSLAPVAFFILSIPVAFVSTPLAVCCWFLGIPFAAIAARWKPKGADELLLG